MLDDLKKRGVKFRSLNEATDTEMPTDRAMWQMISVPAELERGLISERTRAGVKAAKGRREIRARTETDTAVDNPRPEADRRRRAPRGRGHAFERGPHHLLPALAAS